MHVETAFLSASRLYLEHRALFKALGVLVGLLSINRSLKRLRITVQMLNEIVDGMGTVGETFWNAMGRMRMSKIRQQRAVLTANTELEVYRSDLNPINFKQRTAFDSSENLEPQRQRS